MECLRKKELDVLIGVPTIPLALADGADESAIGVPTAPVVLEEAVGVPTIPDCELVAELRVCETPWFIGTPTIGVADVLVDVAD